MTYVKYRNLLIIVLPIVLHFLILSKWPVFGDDFQRGVLDYRPLSLETQNKIIYESEKYKIVSSNTEPRITIENESAFIPILFQGRETAFSYNLLKSLNTFLSPINSIIVYKTLLFFVMHFLIVRMSLKIRSDNLLFLAPLFFSPIYLFSFGPYLADQLALTFLVIAVTGFLYRKRSVFILFLILSVITRLAFIIYIIPMLAFLYYKPIRNNFKLISLFSLAFFILALPLIIFFKDEFLIDLDFIKTLSYYQTFSLDILKFFVNENAFLSYFLRWRNEYDYLFYGPVLIKTYLIYYIYKKMGKDFVSKRFIILLSYFFSVLFLLTILTYEFSSPLDYIYPLIFLSPLFWITIMDFLNKNRTDLLVYSVIVFSIFWTYQYIVQGPAPAINARVINQFTLELERNNIESFYTVDKYFWAQTDYFSKGKVKSIFTPKIEPSQKFHVQLCGHSWGEHKYLKQDDNLGLCKLKKGFCTVISDKNSSYLCLKSSISQ